MRRDDDAVEGFDLAERAFELPLTEREAYVRRESAGDASLCKRALRLLRDAELELQADADADELELESSPPEPIRLVTSTVTAELLSRLGGWETLDTARYEVHDTLGVGGMGQVIRVEDNCLRRSLAMKTPHVGPLRTEEERQRASLLLGRFLEEAQVTSQLDHPGVVPVHDLGLDSSGQPYFLMRRVRGESASSAFEKAREGRDGWTLTRALEVVLKVCDTVAYAHEKGVLHRDLKPDNIQVGSFGEVYVMDWGLAKIVGQPDRHDLQVASEPAIISTRELDAKANPESSVVTIDGKAIGTVFYMAPEQALSAGVDHRTDIYAIGATLYELLSGKPPYYHADSWPADVLEEVRKGPPVRIESLVAGVASELVAIVEKAMHRDPEQRYARVVDLAADVRAFVDGRVVKAYRTGSFVELRMWVRRNKLLAASLAAVMVSLAAGGAIAAWYADRLGVRVREFDQVSAVVEYDRSVEDERELYPARPRTIAAMQQWLSRCSELLRMRPEIQRTIDGIGKDVPDRPRQFLRDELVELIGKLGRLDVMQRAAVEHRIAWAQQIERASLHHPNSMISWGDVRSQIGKSPNYQGLSIELRDEDVVGLVPLGRNPKTGYFEFYHLRSACVGATGPGSVAIPQRGEDGFIQVVADTGIVFVLLPGGVVTLGSQGDDENAAFFDSERNPDEQLHQVDLAPFFLAQHELTQGQCARLWTVYEPERHENQYAAGDDDYIDGTISPAHPVDTIGWEVCDLMFSRHALVLPTEAQWEYGCRGGTSTPWQVKKSALKDSANLADMTAEKWLRPVEQWSDGHVVIAAVGSFRSNTFGLFDMHGNVVEWCRDLYSEYGTEKAGDGLRADEDSDETTRSYRGGYSSGMADKARSAYRGHMEPTLPVIFSGVRAARSLTPQ